MFKASASLLERESSVAFYPIIYVIGPQESRVREDIHPLIVLSEVAIDSSPESLVGTVFVRIPTLAFHIASQSSTSMHLAQSVFRPLSGTKP